MHILKQIKRWFFILLVSMVLSSSLVEPARAQSTLGETVIRVVPSTRSTAVSRSVSDFGYIEISGNIRRSAVTRLAAAFPQAQRTTGSLTLSGEPVVRVFINSRGGEILAAIQMGEIIRSQAAEVWVDKTAECSSACILVLAGGVSRVAIPGAKLGLHRPFFPPEEFAGLSYSESQKTYSTLAAGVKDYLSRMGIAEPLYDAMIRVPSQKVRYIDESFAESTRLLGDDPAYQEWRRAKDRKFLGKERLEKLDRYIDCVNEGKAERECSRFLSGWNH